MMKWKRKIYGIFIGFVVTLFTYPIFQVWILKNNNPQSSALMELRIKQNNKKLRFSWRPIQKIPTKFLQAIIASEDAKFYEHNGFDFNAILLAYKKNERKGKISHGASTITQQLAKNMFLNPRRSYIRKIAEVYYSILIELMLPKKRILEIYINIIEWGKEVFGIEQASLYHFNRPIEKLTLHEMCLLVGLIPSPLRYNINQKYIQKRAITISRRLQR